MPRTARSARHARFILELLPAAPRAPARMCNARGEMQISFAHFVLEFNVVRRKRGYISICRNARAARACHAKPISRVIWSVLTTRELARRQIQRNIGCINYLPRRGSLRDAIFSRDSLESLIMYYRWLTGRLLLPWRCHHRHVRIKRPA